MKYPLISIAIATFNSEQTLRTTLESIREQTYPKNKVEILVIDGGSVDGTVSIAKRFKCKVINNPKTELIFAKHIGFFKARGKYLMFLDSDEVLENPDSLKIKYSSFQKDQRIKAVMISGYKAPQDYSPINHYIDEFGDPFSFFIYQESKGEKLLLRNWLKKYKKVYEDRECAIFDFHNSHPLPIIELWAGGCMIDLEYAKGAFPQINKQSGLIAHLFYLLNKQNCLLAITKKDPTIHYSSKNLSKYMKKIDSRIKNNIYQTEMGDGGFLGRENFQPSWFRLKKYLFPFYAFSIILPTIDAIDLAITRQKLIYLMHLPLCIYTALLIVYHLVLKTLGIHPRIKTYGQ